MATPCTNSLGGDSPVLLLTRLLTCSFRLRMCRFRLRMCRFRLRMRNFTGAWKGHENAADENESCNAENRTGTRENSPTPFRRGTRVPSRSSSMPGGFNIPPCKTCNVDMTGSESFEPLPMGYGNGSPTLSLGDGMMPRRDRLAQTRATLIMVKSARGSEGGTCITAATA